MVMIRMKRLSYILSLLGLSMMGQAQQPSGEYISPSQTVPRGKAPKMQIQLLSRSEQTREYAVIFGKDDEALSGLLEFAEKYHITSAHFTAIAALNGGP